MDSLIRWKTIDSIRLEKAINRFNRELAKADKTVNLPTKVNYNDIRDKIVTRGELETTIRSLNKGTRESFSATESLASGEKISKWEFDETLRRKKVASENLLNELDKINRERAETGNRYMGEERISEIQSTLDLLNESLDSTTKLAENQKRLLNLGRTDRETYLNKIFMENYKTALEGAKNFENYDKFKKLLNSVKNPNKFYELVKKSPTMMDIFLWYKNPEGDAVYSSFDTNEQAFNSALANDFDLPINLE